MHRYQNRRICLVGINCLSQSFTVVMIAHRLSTIESCDRVIQLKDGKVQANGPPSQVLSSFS